VSSVLTTTKFLLTLESVLTVVHDSITCVSKIYFFFLNVQTGRGAQKAPCLMGVFSGVKHLERKTDHIYFKIICRFLFKGKTKR
jgi:hypothetical protein